ncbi:MAG TPA: four-carbon acid sugar kinase family protein [Streptosporangiaceae bacterium]|nr:four-carbon acid sugar kinase family protein [Streptosporangiaceae bacterium]
MADGTPSGPLSLDQLLAGVSPGREVAVDQVSRAIGKSKRRLVVLDDDPTGTQTVAGLPVLTSWTRDNLRWALRQPSPAFFILTNSRSLAPAAMTGLNREVVSELAAAAQAEDADFVIASRSDSTLRGHYPLETDVIADALREHGGRDTDGVVLVPAYLDAGRLTVNSVHWIRGPSGFIPVGDSEFARDPAFAYTSSDLRDYVAEKTAGRWPRGQVARITLADIRSGGPARVAEILGGLHGGRPAVADAVTDDDLRVVVLGAIQAEDAGVSLLYRVGPSFVRARAGQAAAAPLTGCELTALGLAGGAAGRHGLVVVGSHVPHSTRQLEYLLSMDNVVRVDLEVPAVLHPDTRDSTVAAASAAVGAALARADVALCTSRELVTTAKADGNLEIARTVSAALVDVVRRVAGQVRPAWIIGKGGITSSDLATKALGLTRAMVRGTLLPGIVSLWDPVTKQDGQAPLVVFAGNVGDEHALARTVARLRGRE